MSRFLAESSEALAAIALDGRVLAASPSWSTLVAGDAAGVLGSVLAATVDHDGLRRVAFGPMTLTAWEVAADLVLVRATWSAATTPDRFFTLIDAFPFAIGVHRDLRFVYVNRAAVSYLGYDRPEELIGCPILAILDPSEIDTVKVRVAHMMRTREPVPERETRLVRKDGHIVIADLAAFAIHDADGLPSYVVVARDITERKALEERLRHGQRMEAVGRLAGGIAHDFNNLLAVILSYAEIIGAALPEGSAEAEHAQAIQRGAERAAVLTQELLTFSRGQASEPEPLRANDIVLGLEGFLRRSLGGQATLVTALQGNLPAIRASAAQLEQILMNLAINARDAMPAGGEVRVQTSLVVVPAGDAWARRDGEAGADSLEPGPYVCIEVIDGGVGMTPEVASRAFEPFFTTKTPGKGTGLGLSTVYGLVRQAGGRCELVTAPGRGTKVRILWPAITTSQAPVTAPAQRPAVTTAPATRPGIRPGGPAYRVLVVEDDEAVRLLVTRLLRGKGFEVTEAGDGPEALTRAAELTSAGRPPELLLSDIVMPLMDGPTLVERLHVELPGLPVIFMSGFADDVVELEELAQKGFGFVPKPFTTAELLGKVRAALEPGA